jgi:hypothetical protein
VPQHPGQQVGEECGACHRAVLNDSVPVGGESSDFIFANPPRPVDPRDELQVSQPDPAERPLRIFDAGFGSDRAKGGDA